MPTEDELIRQAQNKLSEAAALLNMVVNKIENRESLKVDWEFLNTPINNIDFGSGYTARVHNICAGHNDYVGCDSTGPKYKPAPIVTVRDFVVKTEAELLREPNFGRKSIARAKAVLALHGLHFGMEL